MIEIDEADIYDVLPVIRGLLYDILIRKLSKVTQSSDLGKITVYKTTPNVCRIDILLNNE